jgi:platelet-activating factor acetylhydrolase
MGAGKSIINRCLTDEHFLETDILDELPTENRPPDAWIAARLKIPHELRTRIATKTQRKLKHKISGACCGPRHEVWMHYKPDMTELQDWWLNRRYTNPKLNKGIQGLDGSQSDVERSGDSARA